MTKQEFLKSIKKTDKEHIADNRELFERVLAKTETLRNSLINVFSNLFNDELSYEVQDAIRSYKEAVGKYPAIPITHPFEMQYVIFTEGSVKLCRRHAPTPISGISASDFSSFFSDDFKKDLSIEKLTEVYECLRDYKVLYDAVKEALPDLYDELEKALNRSQHEQLDRLRAIVLEPDMCIPDEQELGDYE